MIAVAGGTGRLGSLVVADLVDKGEEVRVLTRDPARAGHLAQKGVEVVRGDVRDRASLTEAFHGASVVVSAIQGFAGTGKVTPESVDHRGNVALIDAAAAAGADVVMLSVIGAAADHPMELFRAKHSAEEHLRTSGVRWTIVRASAFLETWSQIMTKPVVFGRGENPINFVSVRDVAAVVEKAVLDPNLRGEVLEVGGTNLTFNQLSSLLLKVHADTRTVRHVPLAVLRIMARLDRRARASVVMDTTDMTFDALSARAQFSEVPITDPRTALEALRNARTPTGALPVVLAPSAPPMSKRRA